VIEIYDIDNTLTTGGDTPRQDLIDYIKTDVQDEGVRIFIVSGRPISRLAETEKWLRDNGVPYEEIYLNDFSETPGPNVIEAFKAYKYAKIVEEYGLAEIGYVVDDSAEARSNAEGMGIKAYTAQELLAAEALHGAEGEDDSDEDRAVYQVPDYIRNAAARGLSFVEDGLGGEGLQPETIADARELAAGRADTDKVIRTAAWIRRHRGDWEGVPQNEDEDNADFPGPGAVAGFLWGVETTDREATDRVLSWADALIAAEDREIVDMKEKETRSVPIGEFRLAEAGADGQRTFTGYASIWNSASAGLPFEEKIAPNAFKRSLSRAAAGQKIIAFLFGHDETRALATTASGRLQLTEDETGLRVEAKLDPADPDAAKVISMLTHESAAAGMSFGFQKVQDAWDGNNRTIKEANLFEVSILAAGGQTPAYPATLGLTAIRQVTAPKIGVEAEALLATLETIKAGRELSAEEVVVIDAVRSKLAPKPVGIDPSIAAALLTVSAAEGDAL
jgi:HK97 family phage prohead protease